MGSQKSTVAMTELPHLDDQAKLALCEKLQRWGLLERKGDGWICTLEGHYAGCMLYAVAALEEAAHKRNTPFN
jgi:hypothetical protein